MAGKEAVQSLTELDMGLSVQEDPVVLAEQLVSDVHDAGLDVGGRVEDLPRQITARSDHDKPGQSCLDSILSLLLMYLLVENRHTAQLSAVPFGLVLVEFGVHRLEERSHERNFHRRAGNRSLEVDVFH